MKTRQLFSFCYAWIASILMFGAITIQAQQISQFGGKRTPNSTFKTFEEDLAPFYHGVASGDPTAHSIILWTRVTPPDLNTESVDVFWQIARDTAFTQIVQEGSSSAIASKDFTVNVKVDNLDAGTVYYYGFYALGKTSIVGRTRTAPTDSEHLRFAVVSCSNYQHGYFNSYARIAERNDLDAVIHLGDYIYEYGADTADARLGLLPDEEILELADYRTRHSFYKLDPDLRRLHQMHPIIAVWDDHEVANDAYKDGAENHTPATEGDYHERKSVAQQAYMEWMPMDTDGSDNSKIYRKLSYGNLADLIMLDTRHYARDKQIESLEDSTFHSDTRTMLGDVQKEWLKTELSNSTAKWKLIGNQILFAPLIIEPLIVLNASALSILRDIWEGYPNERNELVQFISDNEMDNIVFLTGDIHATFAFDVTPYPGTDTSLYNPNTGLNSVAVEFVTTSISSDGFNEYVGDGSATFLENILKNINQQIRLSNFFEHGYFVLDVTEDKTQADWFFDSNRLVPNNTENFFKACYTLAGENHIRISDQPSTGKSTLDIVPPAVTRPPFDLVGIHDDATLYQNSGSQLVLLHLLPNPATDFIQIGYALNEATTVSVNLVAANGTIHSLATAQTQSKGLYSRIFDTSQLPAGVYTLLISSQQSSTAVQLQIVH